MGKAGAITSGMLDAEGEYVLFTDMDQATPIEEINKLLPFIEQLRHRYRQPGFKRKGAHGPEL